MKTGTFMDIVGIHYDDIKKLYIKRECSNGRKFNEDSFNTAFIKCAKHFENNTLDYDTVVKYFWVAYVNTSKNEYKYNSNTELCDEFNFDILDDDDEESFAQKLYTTVMDAISYVYSEEDMLIYSLYKYHGWKKEELIEAGYNCENFETRIKEIHKFVKEYTKKHFKI